VRCRRLQDLHVLQNTYTLSKVWSGVNWADLMAAQGAFGTDLYDRFIILRPKHRAYYRSSGPVVKIGPKAAMRSAQFTTLQASDRVYHEFSKKEVSSISHSH